MYLLALLGIACLLVLSIVWAGRPQGRTRALQGLLTALLLAVVYEFAVAQFHPEWNIRIEFALVPLFLVALSKVVFPPTTPPPSTQQLEELPGASAESAAQATTDANALNSSPGSQDSAKQASRSLTLSLVNVVFWMLPVLAIPAIYFGHRALLGHPTNKDRLKAIIGLLVGYPQVLAAAYLWFFS